jgi:hypothetical protein
MTPGNPDYKGLVRISLGARLSEPIGHRAAQSSRVPRKTGYKSETRQINRGTDVFLVCQILPPKAYGDGNRTKFKSNQRVQ